MDTACIDTERVSFSWLEDFRCLAVRLEYHAANHFDFIRRACRYQLNIYETRAAPKKHNLLRLVLIRVYRFLLMRGQGL